MISFMKSCVCQPGVTPIHASTEEFVLRILTLSTATVISQATTVECATSVSISRRYLLQFSAAHDQFFVHAL